MKIFQDDTGIFVERANSSEREYLVRTLVEENGEVLYRFNLDTRILEASIAPGTLEILVHSQGWSPGKDLRLPDSPYPAKEAGDCVLRFPSVNEVRSVHDKQGKYFFEGLVPMNIGLLAAIKKSITHRRQ